MPAEDQIRQYAERIVRLEEERKALAADIKDCKAEAKAAGFSPKLIAKCVAIMLMDAEKRAAALGDHEEIDLYLSAVGLIARAEVFETRQDAGGSGYAGSAMAARAAARDEDEADVVRETVPSVSSPQNAVPEFQPASQDAGQPEHARIASDEVPVGGRGNFAGQSEECVAVAEAGEGVVMAPRDPVSAPDGYSHLARS